MIRLKPVVAPVSRLRSFLSVYMLLAASFLHAQLNVTTYKYNNARDGQNTQETILTPALVNYHQFGKLFTATLDGYVYAQPLFLAGQNIAGGTHNVLYVATEHDSLFALDADTGAVLWQKSFIDPADGITTVSSGDVSCGDLVPEIGITSTPVIDPTSGTIYTVAKTKENGVFFQRIHALDVITGVEKFGGPVTVAATVPGTGQGGSTVSFDPLRNHNRPGLLLENGHVVIAWASHCDNTPYDGWVMSYNAATLAQEAVLNTAPNGGLAGIWMSGDGAASDSSGNIFLATGNGSYDGQTYNDYGDSILRLTGPTNGALSVADWFTPWNQGSLSNGDVDVGSGGLVLLPDLPPGSQYLHLLTQMGKEGKIYLINRDNMGRYCSSCNGVDTNIVQEIPGASTGIWGSPAFWNNNIYWSSGNDDGPSDNLLAFSFNANNSGLISTSPTSKSTMSFSYSTGAPVVSANGASNGIVWLLDNHTYNSGCCQVLYAFDATNLANMLYNSNQAPANRDVPGDAVKFTAPMVVNGKVYVGSQGQVSAFGIISNTPTVATPTFSPAPGSYSGSVVVTLSDTTNGAVIHCTTDGTTPTSSSPVCSTLTLTTTTTIEAIAVATGYNNSAVAVGTYGIGTGTGVNYGNGFTASGLILNGSSTVNGSRLRLTDGNAEEAATAYYATPVNIQTFTNNFSFQLTNPYGDGITFLIQNSGVNAIGPNGGGLGYGPALPAGPPGISPSVAIKFDLYNNDGEGVNSTGIYTDGASPTVPSIDLTPSGVNLHSGDIFNVQMTYDGTNLGMTVTDASNSADVFNATWPINIPSTVGSSTAFLGFSAGTGGATATQDVLQWTYLSGSAAQPTTTAITSSANPSYVGQAVTYTATVTAQSGTPTGTVTFQQNGQMLGTANLTNGVATYSTVYNVTGAYSIVAIYGGSSSYIGSSSSPLTQTVKRLPAATTTLLTSSANSVYVGQSVTLTAKITSTYGSVPDGEIVTFKSGTMLLGTGTTVSGTATLTAPANIVGQHTLKAYYPGDGTFAASTSNAVAITVSKYSTTTSLTSAPNPSNQGQAVLFTASVTSSGPQSPTGDVTFHDGTRAIGRAVLSDGVAVLSKSNLAPGSHSITATYGGDSQSLSSVSNIVTQVVN